MSSDKKMDMQKKATVSQVSKNTGAGKGSKNAPQHKNKGAENHAKKMEKELATKSFCLDLNDFPPLPTSKSTNSNKKDEKVEIMVLTNKLEATDAKIPNTVTDAEATVTDAVYAETADQNMPTAESVASDKHVTFADTAAVEKVEPLLNSNRTILLKKIDSAKHVTFGDAQVAEKVGSFPNAPKGILLKKVGFGKNVTFADNVAEKNESLTNSPRTVLLKRVGAEKRVTFADTPPVEKTVPLSISNRKVLLKRGGAEKHVTFADTHVVEKAKPLSNSSPIVILKRVGAGKNVTFANNHVAEKAEPQKVLLKRVSAGENVTFAENVAPLLNSNDNKTNNENKHGAELLAMVMKSVDKEIASNMAFALNCMSEEERGKLNAENERKCAEMDTLNMPHTPESLEDYANMFRKYYKVNSLDPMFAANKATIKLSIITREAQELIKSIDDYETANKKFYEDLLKDCKNKISILKELGLLHIPHIVENKIEHDIAQWRVRIGGLKREKQNIDVEFKLFYDTLKSLVVNRFPKYESVRIYIDLLKKNQEMAKKCYEKISLELSELGRLITALKNEKNKKLLEDPFKDKMVIVEVIKKGEPKKNRTGRNRLKIHTGFSHRRRELYNAFSMPSFLMHRHRDSTSAHRDSLDMLLMMHDLPSSIQLHNQRQAANIKELSENSLFHEFYKEKIPVKKLVLAKELYDREWRFHILLDCWLRQKPEERYSTDIGTTDGVYAVYDKVRRRVVSKHLFVENDLLETTPNFNTPQIAYIN